MKNLMGKVNSKMRENKRNGRKALKGFTLVEIIVVLVILAILAAAMIPALTGYIDKAKQRTALAEARNAVTAAQTLASEAYGLGRTVQNTALAQGKTADSNYTYAKMKDLGELPGTIERVTLDDKNKVTVLVYKTTNDEYVAYYAGTTASGKTAVPVGETAAITIESGITGPYKTDPWAQ